MLVLELFSSHRVGIVACYPANMATVSGVSRHSPCNTNLLWGEEYNTAEAEKQTTSH
jgi:hypothetical protein